MNDDSSGTGIARDGYDAASSAMTTGRARKDGAYDDLVRRQLAGELVHPAGSDEREVEEANSIIEQMHLYGQGAGVFDFPGEPVRVTTSGGWSAPESRKEEEKEEEDDALAGGAAPRRPCGKRARHGDEVDFDAAPLPGRNTCYLASALQVIYRTPALLACVTDVHNLPEKSKYPESDDLTLVNRLELTAEVLRAGLSISPLRHAETMEETRREFITLGVIAESNFAAQDDAGDLIMKILDRLAPEKVPGLSVPVTRIFNVPQECSAENAEVIADLFRPAKENAESPGVPYIGFGKGSSGDLLTALVQRDIIEGDPRRVLENSWRIRGDDIVMFNIDRHYFENGVYKTSKVTLDLSPSGTLELPVHKDGGEHPVLFGLSACTAYAGRGVSGHWVAVAWVHGEWHKFDGHVAWPLGTREAVAICSTAGSFVVFEKTHLDATEGRAPTHFAYLDDAVAGWDAEAADRVVASLKDVVAGVSHQRSARAAEGDAPASEPPALGADAAAVADFADSGRLSEWLAAAKKAEVGRRATSLRLLAGVLECEGLLKETRGVDEEGSTSEGDTEEADEEGPDDGPDEDGGYHL